MKYEFFVIPVFNAEQAQTELNAFLARHKIRDVSREFVNNGQNSAWCVSVLYDDSPVTANTESNTSGKRSPRVDYREVLSADDFAVFSPLRKLRNELADSAGIPPYAVLSNEQLAALVTRRVGTISEFGEIEGVGPRRLEQYGEALLAKLKELQRELPSAKQDSEE